jgi:membrane associated rhomboid family serine protease
MSNYRRNRNPGINPIWVIIGVNLVIFLTTFLNQGLIYDRFGLTPNMLAKQPWTIVTYMFVHADIFHILFNMITLYFFGTFVMSLLGETTFLITYFVGGIVGGLFFWLLAPLVGNQYTTVVGASGAIYALGGLLMVMRPNVKVMTFPIPVPMPLWIAILIGFVLVSFFPGVAWEAHLGGIVYGAVIGYFFRRREFRRY